MRTEPDLRAALASREALAPDADRVLLAVTQGRRRRLPAVATIAATAAAMASVVAIVTAPVLLSRSDGQSPSPTGPGASAPVGAPAVDEHAADRPALFFSVAAGEVGDYRIRPSMVSDAAQFARIETAGQLAAVLLLNRPGSDTRIVGMFGGNAHGDPEAAPNTDIGGTPALFSAERGWSGLRWEYAPGATAVLGTAFGSPELPEETLVEIAAAVTFVEPYPLRLPFRLDVVPADLHPRNASVGYEGVHATVQWEGEGRALDIMLLDNPPELADAIFSSYRNWDWHETTIAGRAARYADLSDGRRCEVQFGSHVIALGCGALTATELEQLVAGITLADPAAPATWFAVNDAIPGA